MAPGRSKMAEWPYQSQSLFKVPPKDNGARNPPASSRLQTKVSRATAMSMDAELVRLNHMNAQDSCPLFTLPPELRLQIYECLFEFQISDEGDRTRCCPIPPLLRTCLRIKNDALEAWFKCVNATTHVNNEERSAAYNVDYPKGFAASSYLISLANAKGRREWIEAQFTIEKTSEALRELFVISHALDRFMVAPLQVEAASVTSSDR